MSNDSVPITRIRVSDRARDLIAEVLESGRLAQGPMVERFEGLLAGVAGTRHAVAVTSGTSALVASLRALGIGTGDEVITSPFTFAATVNAILAVGAVARFADIGHDYNVDVEAVEALIGEDTAVIMPVHLYGLMADMRSILAVAGRHNLALVEDAAQAIGASAGGIKAGQSGLGCFSFYATKNVTTGEGGAITTDDADLASFLRTLRNQGMRERYEYLFPGENLRMTDLQAALGIPQIEELDDITNRRRSNALTLTTALSDLEWLTLPAEPDGYTHVFHQYTMSLSANAPLSRDELKEALEARGVATGVYYPRPAFDYSCYREHPRVMDSDPVPRAFDLSRQVLSLPVHHLLTEDEVTRVAEAVRASSTAI